MDKIRSVLLGSAIASASAAISAEPAHADSPINIRLPSSSSSTSPASTPNTPSGDPPPQAEEPKPRNNNPRTSASGFDPEALERGVKALREINSSPNAKKVFEFMKKREETRQSELATKKSDFEKEISLLDTGDNEMQRLRNQELVRMQEESSMRQERARMATEEQIQAQQRKTEKERADVERETIRVKAMAEAEGRAHEAKLGGLRAILTDQNKLVVTVGGITALAAGIYTTREGARVVWGYVDRILGQPSLIRESSRGKYPWSAPFSQAKRTLSEKNKGSNKSGFGDVILHPSLLNRIEQLSGATANTKSHKAPFRNMLFYGPPGTGKTMAARELARKSGLDYALMTGGDVAPLGSQAVTKIHQLFDWAKKSRRGLLLFIDEADAFLCERNKTYMSEAQRSALNALLFRTGDQSKDIVLALATNRPGDLDSAVSDRIDEVLEFPLPGEDERFKLLNLYLDKYIARAGEEKKPSWLSFFRKQQQLIQIKNLTDDVIREAAVKTEGFSGREIAKLMASVQAAVYGSKECKLDPDLFRDVVDYKVAEHQQRGRLASGRGGE
ncbi:hypothetical protein QJS04_geneDACA008886 [Acorus gramineus]|uniref:AAA+ ATPase domain-containing protein n=1 Tax=Acorus gramineus TaxID=55184 RepID=A0AAV9ABE2_ACOGR|nr:hypothetical protein QJS04_geneDACA008886 [Acorus gramineus]